MSHHINIACLGDCFQKPRRRRFFQLITQLYTINKSNMNKRIAYISYSIYINIEWTRWAGWDYLLSSVPGSNYNLPQSTNNTGRQSGSQAASLGIAHLAHRCSAVQQPGYCSAVLIPRAADADQIMFTGEHISDGHFLQYNIGMPSILCIFLLQDTRTAHKHHISVLTRVLVAIGLTFYDYCCARGGPTANPSPTRVSQPAQSHSSCWWCTAKTWSTKHEIHERIYVQRGYIGCNSSIAIAVPW